jgi:hypothetical protein
MYVVHDLHVTSWRTLELFKRFAHSADPFWRIGCLDGWRAGGLKESGGIWRKFEEVWRRSGGAWRWSGGDLEGFGSDLEGLGADLEGFRCDLEGLGGDLEKF